MLHWFIRTLTLFALLFSFAQGQVTVGVDPVAKLYTATPGQSITQVLNVYNPNPAEAKLRVVAYLMDMDMNQVGETTYVAPGTMKESVSPWTTVTPSEIELGPEETKQVRYTIQVPANAAPGTHWAMLMFEGQEPNAKPGKTLAAFHIRVGHTIYVDVKPGKVEGNISGIFDEAPKSETGFYQMGVQYTNSGNSATGVQGRVEVRDAKGELVATFPLELMVALPGHTVLLRHSWSGPVPKGQYSALVILQDAVEGRDLVADHVINIPFDLKARQAATPDSATTPATTPATPDSATAPPASPTPAAPGGKP